MPPLITLHPSTVERDARTEADLRACRTSASSRAAWRVATAAAPLWVASQASQATRGAVSSGDPNLCMIIPNLAVVPPDPPGGRQDGGRGAGPERGSSSARVNDLLQGVQQPTPVSCASCCARLRRSRQPAARAPSATLVGNNIALELTPTADLVEAPAAGTSSTPTSGF